MIVSLLQYIKIIAPPDLIKKFISFSAGNLILKCAMVIVGLTTIKFLTPQEYGLVALLNNFSIIAPIFMNLGLRQAYGVEYFHLDAEKRISELIVIIKSYLLIAVPIFLFLVLFIGQINSFVFFNLANKKLIFIVLFGSFLHFFSELYLQTLRYTQNVYQLLFKQIISACLIIIATILLVYTLKLKALGIVIANTSAIVYLSVYGLRTFFASAHQEKAGANRYLKGTIWPIKELFEKTKYYLKIGFPFIPNIFFTWVLSSSGKWFLAKYSTLQAVGIYSLADYFCQIFNVVIISSIASVYIPHLFNKFAVNKNQSYEIYKWNLRVMVYFCLATLILIFTGLIATKGLLLWLLPQAYQNSINYLFFLLIGQVLYAACHFASAYLQFNKKNFIILFATIAAVSCNLLISYILILRCDVWGVVIANIVGYLSYLAIVLGVTRNCVKT